MANWIVFYIACTVAFYSMSLFMDSNPGLVTAQLQTALSETSTTVTVDSTTGFLDQDFIIIDDEEICYTTRGATTFTGLERGCNGTTAAKHPIKRNGTRVYNQGTGFVNRLVGFRLINYISTGDVLKAPWKAFGVLGEFGRGIASMIIWDFPFLNAPGIIYFKYILLFAISGGLVINMILSFVARR